MLITVIPSGPFDTNAYIVGCEATKQAAIVDPAPKSAHSITTYLAEHQLVLTKILITHSHWDHIGDAAEIHEKFHVPIYIHPYDAGNLEKPGSDGLPCWLRIHGVKADHLIHEGEKITVGDLVFEVIETPGHTPGGVCFYNEEYQVLFSGDTLFKGTIGNLSFPTARPHLMWDSLSKLAKLPSETKVYPGHGSKTTIGEEKWLANAEELFGD